MNTQELEELLEGGAETQRLDFKCACECNVDALAKDILAFSNVQDGGFIIIGIEEAKDGSFIRRGVPPKQRETYKEDVMKDQMAKYADPHVNFNVIFMRDNGGLEYVVIRVFQFEEIPVICRKNGIELVACTIYYRNKNRRVESAAVSNAYDIRNIIELATVKMMQRKRELGFTVEKSDEKKLEEERENL